MAGRRQKGLIFLIVLPLMFGWACGCSGGSFRWKISEPLVFLGAIADRGIGAPFCIAKMMDAGAGTVVAVSYEYGNTFLMTAGC